MKASVKHVVAVSGAAVLLLVSGVVLADITMPNKFNAGTTIKSSEVNANFDALNAGKQDKLVAFTHVASLANIAPPPNGNYTVIDNAATNGNPNAILIVTPNRSPVGVTSPYYYGSISVQYNAAASKWSILHDKGPSEPIQAAESFNVLVFR